MCSEAKFQNKPMLLSCLMWHWFDDVVGWPWFNIIYSNTIYKEIKNVVCDLIAPYSSQIDFPTSLNVNIPLAAANICL